MDDDKRKKVGKKGEDVAAFFLKKRGYRILDRNFRCYLGELDIIAEKEGQIIFVEVKTRQNIDFGLPEEFLNYPKRKRLSKLALFYLSTHYLQERPCRFDVVAIQYQKGKAKIHHIKNAFQAIS